MNNKPYTLTLFSPSKPDGPDKIFSSADMISYELWAEFTNLPHITMQYMSAADDTSIIPACDFALIHCYFNYPIFKRLPEIRVNTRHKIILVMEFKYGGLNADLIDRSFTFLACPDAEHIRLPYYKPLLDNSALKTPGTILLDHQWSGTEAIEDICHSLYEWFKPPYNRPMAQLRRPAVEAIEIPIWIHSIPLTNYYDYLVQTKSYETFIVTHRGSYEHSIIDMAARGTRVLVPIKDGRTFCHPSIIEDLNLETFSNREELFTLLEQPHLTYQQMKFTDMSDVVAKIDAYCQTVK
jgi:hypothetical protein